MWGARDQEVIWGPHRNNSIGLRWVNTSAARVTTWTSASQCEIWDHTCTSGGSFRTTAALLKHWPMSWDVFHNSLRSMKHLPTTCHTCTPPELMGYTHSCQSELSWVLPMVADGSRQVVNKNWWGGCVWWVILGFSVTCYLGMKVVRVTLLWCFVWLGGCQQAATVCVIVPLQTY